MFVLPVVLLLFGVTTFCVAFLISDVVPLLFIFCASFLILSASDNCPCCLSVDNGSTILGSNPFANTSTTSTDGKTTNTNSGVTESEGNTTNKKENTEPSTGVNIFKNKSNGK